MSQIGSGLKIIGVSHLSQKSIEEVKRAILYEKPVAIALELCPIRLQVLLNSRKTSISFKSVLKGGFSSFLGVVFAFLQHRLGKKIGIEPGEEMLIALRTAQEINATIFLIDQDIKFILARLFERLTFRERMRLFCEIFLTFLPLGISRVNITDLLNPETAERYLHYFKKILPNAYKVLVEDRDKTMSLSLINISKQFPLDSKIIAVVGLAHVKGIEENLEKIRRYEADYAIQ